MRFRISAVVALAVFSWFMTGPVARAQFWQKKDFAKWSPSECRELLSKSPWANEYKIATVVFEPLSSGPANTGPAVEGREGTPHVTYQAQFWSAKPIREAMVRLQQSDDKYRKLPPEQKQVFDERSAQFLNMEFPETIVIQLNYTTVQAYSLPLSRFWSSKSNDELKKLFVLIGASGRLEPLQVVVQQATGSGAAFQLVFPRKPNGVPMANPELKQLALEVAHPGIDGVLPPERVFIPFKVKNMIMNGEVIY